MIHSHAGAWRNTLIIGIGCDSDDPPRLGLDADETHDRISPRQMMVHRILVGEHALRQGAAYDHYLLAALPVAIVKIPSGNKGNVHRAEKSRRDDAETGARIFFPRRRYAAFRRKVEARTKFAAVPPRREGSHADAIDAGKLRDFPDRIVVTPE